MKAITDKNKLPKFLVVNKEAESTPWNKHLLKPWKKGEVVKVAPFEEQVRDDRYDNQLTHCVPNNDLQWFRERYVVVYRKDKDGKWSLKYTENWGSFDLLTIKKK